MNSIPVALSLTIHCVSPTVGAGFQSRPGVGFGWAELAVLSCWTLGWCCDSTPFLWSCPKKRGGAPKKSAWGGGAPVRFRDPPASPTRVGGATRPLRCPLRGRIESLAPGARGWAGYRLASKSFLPRFFTKKRAGSRGGALAARRSARNSPVLMKRRRGSKGEPSPGVPPLRAAPAARSPRDTAITPVVNARRAGVEPRPYEGLAERGGAGVDCEGGTSRTPSPTGRVRRRGAGSNPASGRGRPHPYRGWRNAVTLAVDRPLQGGCDLHLCEKTAPAALQYASRGDKIRVCE